MALLPTDKFLSSLRAQLRHGGVQEAELADWLGVSVSTVSRRLNGKSNFSRDEIVVLDEHLGHGGGLLVAAGYMPDADTIPASRFFDEMAFLARFEEVILLNTLSRSTAAVAEQRLKQLLGYLKAVEQTRVVRWHQLRVELELIDAASNRSGVTPQLLRMAIDRRRAIQAVGDRTLTYVYESLLSDLYLGAGDYGRAIAHQRRSLASTEPGPEGDADRLHTDITIARLLTAMDADVSSLPTSLDTAREVLWIDTYRAWEWPSPVDGPSYLDVLHADFAVQVALGGMQKAGSLVELILDKFMTSPRVTDNITSLLCAAEFFARDAQPDMMERHLAEAESLISRFDQHWYGDEVAAIRRLAC
jgi:hypothetical protein